MKMPGMGLLEFVILLAIVIVVIQLVKGCNGSGSLSGGGCNMRKTELIDSVVFGSSDGVSLDNLQIALADSTNKEQAPVVFEASEATGGDLFFGSFTDCPAAYHPEHRSDCCKSYCKMVMVLSRQGPHGSLAVYAASSSP